MASNINRNEHIVKQIDMIYYSKTLINIKYLRFFSPKKKKKEFGLGPTYSISIHILAQIFAIKSYMLVKEDISSSVLH